MKRDNWIVGNYSVRPAGEPDRCFYCGELLGKIHKEDCVIRSKTVVVEFKIEVVVEVPEFWDSNDVDYRFNESSWCCDNLIEMIRREDGCLCSHVEANYLREASEDDEDFWGLVKVDELES